MADIGEPAVSSSERIVLYLSGGGYRAALAAVGALGALGASGRWADVRKVVSVSGGGILNAWLMVKRPETDEDLAEALKELADRLMNRRRSLRNVLLALASASLVVIGVIVACVLSFGIPWVPILVVPLGVVVSSWAVLSLAPRVFLSAEYDFLSRVRGRALGDTEWHREHVFVASDLLASGQVSFICHRQGALIDAPRRGVYRADDVRISTMLRASTALPPILPPVRVPLRSPATTTQVGLMKTPAVRRGFWLVDGGVTGNLGIQSDSSITRDQRRSEDEVRGVRLMAANIARSIDQVTSAFRGLTSLGHASMKSAEALSVYEDNQRALTSVVAKAVIRDFMEDPQNKSLQAEAFGGLDTRTDQSAAQERYSRSLEQYLVKRGVLATSHWDLMDALQEQMPRAGMPVESAPQCGHRPIAWSTCQECTTSTFVVDASGAEPTPRHLTRSAMWMPGVASLLNAVQTMRVQYADNLRADRNLAREHVVSVVRPEEIYHRAARIDRASSDFQRRVRWALAEDILPASPELLPDNDYLRSELAKIGARLPTALTAPRRPAGRTAAQGVLVSGYVNMFLQLDPGKTPQELIDKAQTFFTNGTIAESIASLVPCLLRKKQDMHPRALDRRTNANNMWGVSYRQHLADQKAWDELAAEYEDSKRRMADDSEGDAVTT